MCTVHLRCSAVYADKRRMPTNYVFLFTVADILYLQFYYLYFLCTISTNRIRIGIPKESEMGKNEWEVDLYIRGNGWGKGQWWPRLSCLKSGMHSWWKARGLCSQTSCEGGNGQRDQTACAGGGGLSNYLLLDQQLWIFIVFWAWCVGPIGGEILRNWTWSFSPLKYWDSYGSLHHIKSIHSGLKLTEYI